MISTPSEVLVTIPADRGRAIACFVGAVTTVVTGSIVAILPATSRGPWVSTDAPLVGQVAYLAFLTVVVWLFASVARYFVRRGLASLYPTNVVLSRDSKLLKVPTFDVDGTETGNLNLPLESVFRAETVDRRVRISLFDQTKSLFVPGYALDPAMATLIASEIEDALTRVRGPVDAAVVRATGIPATA